MNRQSGRAVFIVDGSRTPFLKVEKRPGPFTPVDLAVWAGRPLLLRQPFAASAFDDVILGCVNPLYDEFNPGRVAALRLGCGPTTPGWTVQRNCGSGMQSVDCAFGAIAAGRAELILAGGAEALSHAPVLFSAPMVKWLSHWNQSGTVQRAKLLTTLKPDYFSPVVGLSHGLTDPMCGLGMGQTAEILRHQFSISRESADRYALRSHQRLAAAQGNGFLDEIEAMFSTEGDRFEQDNGVRPESTLEVLGALKPTFEPPYGEVTAGNSSQLTDGACWLILASEEAVAQHELKPMARIIDSRWAALPPEVMGLGPVFACTELLQRHNLTMRDIAAWELNEAFAAQVLACLEAWQSREFCTRHLNLNAAFGDIDPDRLNVDGGAISLGHPVGASGARILLHLVHVLQRKEEHYGVATECIGGGQGGAMLLERS